MCEDTNVFHFFQVFVYRRRMCNLHFKYRVKKGTPIASPLWRVRNKIWDAGNKNFLKKAKINHNYGYSDEYLKRYHLFFVTESRILQKKKKK